MTMREERRSLFFVCCSDPPFEKKKDTKISWGCCSFCHLCHPSFSSPPQDIVHEPLNFVVLEPRTKRALPFRGALAPETWHPPLSLVDQVVQSFRVAIAIALQVCGGERRACLQDVASAGVAPGALECEIAGGGGLVSMGRRGGSEGDDEDGGRGRRHCCAGDRVGGASGFGGDGWCAGLWVIGAARGATLQG